MEFTEFQPQHQRAKVKVTQSCLTCDPMNYPVHGILQARILEWVAIPSPGDLPNLGIKPRSPTLEADSLPVEPPEKPLRIYFFHSNPMRQI